MSSRAILMSACDPFAASLVIKLWKERWYDEIDKFYINFNNHCGIPAQAEAEFVGSLVADPKIAFIYHPTGYGNGPPQVELLKICKEDNILLLEDDFFIFKSGIVDSYFKRIESGEVDLLGSPRYAHGEVADAAKEKFNLDYSGSGDRGFGWWPTGFYCKREDLLKTDLDFGSKEYKAGEYFKELNHTFKETCYTDTFTWASIQLRALGLKSAEIPQFHASPTEVEDKEQKTMNWINGVTPTYIHGGSLSTSWNGYLSGRLPDVSNENAVREIETRCAFWIICSQAIEGFKGFKADYQMGIENLITEAGLDRDRIYKKRMIYKELMNV